MNPELQLSDLPVEDIRGICKQMDIDTLSNVVQTATTYNMICQDILSRKREALRQLVNRIYDPRVISFTLKYGGRSETYQPKLDTVDLEFEQVKIMRDGSKRLLRELSSTQLIDHLKSLSNIHVEYVLEAVMKTSGEPEFFSVVLYE